MTCSYFLNQLLGGCKVYNVDSYLKDRFDHSYSDFLLNFKMELLIEGSGE